MQLLQLSLSPLGLLQASSSNRTAPVNWPGLFFYQVYLVKS
jgi:hypothetical protein